jgi:unsaturated rhamnogalacturonyl hydrolase
VFFFASWRINQSIMKINIATIAFLMFGFPALFAQYGEEKKDTNTPLHALQPDYKVPYAPLKPEDVKKIMDKVFTYLDGATPAELVNSKTGELVKDLSKVQKETILKAGDFRLTSYEWGVTYGAMLLAGLNTGDQRYTDYTLQRLKFVQDVVPYFRTYGKQFPQEKNPLRNVLDPRALDDAGAICASMIKAERLGSKSLKLRPLIENYMEYIMTKEFRLKDGTMARNRPLPNTLWLDDLYMSVPAIVQMGKLTGDAKYYDEAVKQIKLFSDRMFNKSRGVYMHGWVESMDVHPEFHWARANGWALLTKVEVLDVLPENHAGRETILVLLREHIKGLSHYQSGEGFWHQLLDKPDSYLETSATAIYAYCIAHAINKGWINREAHAPMALLAWNAVSTKINSKGQVEGTCVGTGMAFDPAFYYYRPVNVYAAHGYGPVIMAGAAMYKLVKDHPAEMNDSALMFPK